MRDIKSSRSPVHTTGNPDQVAQLPFLDQAGIDSALSFILSNWPNAAPMRGEEREAWLDVLCQLRHGELRVALLRRTDNKSHRPQPYALLEVVMDMRASVTQSAQAKVYERNADRMRSLAAEQPGKFDPAEIPAIKEAREKLGVHRT